MAKENLENRKTKDNTIGKSFPFKSIVVWSVSVNLHTDIVFKELSRYFEVILCTKLLEFRGYGKLDLGNIRIISIKTLDDFPKETLSKDYLHISGSTKKVRSFNEPIYDCFLFAIKQGCHTMALNIEQYPWWEGAKGLFRRLQWFWIYNFSSMRKIKAIGCQGESGLLAYKRCFVKTSRLFEFIYSPPCLTPHSPPARLKNIDKYQFSFVGGICNRKCIIPVVKALKATDFDFKFNIAGRGDLESELLQIIEKDERFIYWGQQQPEQIHGLLEYTDCLILPSSFDGWGAVVNEALLHGCRCIVSDGAGSHSLIAHTGYGQIFPSGNYDRFKEVAISEICMGKISDSQREGIKRYSTNIEPQSVANYLVEIINFYFGNYKVKPEIPWKGNIR